MEEDYLPLSGIQRYTFCPRQWALIHIEQQWQENVLTVEGAINHEVAHDASRGETRGNIIITRDMRVFSHRLRLQGACDVVEFHRDEHGHPLHGREGLWKPFPIEYKHGQRDGGLEADSMQLCAQAMCLEEMLLCHIDEGALFYVGARRREPVLFSEAMRERAKLLADEMNALFVRGHTPLPRKRAGCRSCSLKDICIPSLPRRPQVTEYLHTAIQETINPPAPY